MLAAVSVLTAADAHRGLVLRCVQEPGTEQTKQRHFRADRQAAETRRLSTSSQLTSWKAQSGFGNEACLPTKWFILHYPRHQPKGMGELSGKDEGVGEKHPFFIFRRNAGRFGCPPVPLGKWRLERK